ncbi:MAG: hypothetical protein HOI56_02955 [Gammaproteobacteria bacterium]|nr:hypothetical protein [Gammaproteobacteria bacterium]MBT4654807.1 hypothetical protein [Gammaproteobacteria bacterium]MBT5116808.1 hypothetical protein [Gammaproteobacteria bacterium]MBT5761680.1 hypothetical protein [Gammaproteobacteria bacterium]MBT6331089.1 hypothetical protein [Gammaproteobacteria bacterium]
MEKILEIRDGCTTPTQLLKSKAFAQYLDIYKKQFIKELKNRENTDLKDDVLHKIEYINGIDANTYITIIEGQTPFSGNELKAHRDSVKFIDGAFHHYRTKSYTRLVRLHNEILDEGTDAEMIKDNVTLKADKLSELILETRRILLIRAGLGDGVRRTKGLECHPNVAVGEISGHFINLPGDYSSLSQVPMTTAADMRTGVYYTTHANKRAFPFYALDHNPFKNDKFIPEDYVAIPFEVGAWNILCYIHKSRGCVEMEPGLLNLFPFSDVKNITDKQPDGIFIFGCPDSDMNDLGYYHDKENNILVGLIPNLDDCKYFGYGKKPILTLHNVLCILNGDLPLHCGATRYVVRFDENTNEPYIFDSFIKADDMGRARLEKNDEDEVPFFYGTETGAFACLDGFSEHAKMQMEGREIGYNKHSGTNARQIVPVTEYSEISTGSELDILLYLNNYELIKPGDSCMKTDLTADEVLEHFRSGARVAAGSTQTHRGDVEISYWANPFPLLKDKEWKDLPQHVDLCQRFEKIEKKFWNNFKSRADNGKMKLGLAHSMLMAGVYKDSSNDLLKECGFNDRDMVEHEGPERAAHDMIELIKNTAIEKRKSIGDASLKEVDVTVATIGDSRTGKSEMAEKMEGVLNMSLI